MTFPKKCLINVLERTMEEKQKTQRNGGCSNDQNCQQIVSEEELSNLLAQGWRVAAVLPSGKVVVSSG